MNKKIHKLLLPIGAITTVAVPIATVISCNNNSEKKNPAGIGDTPTKSGVGIETPVQPVVTIPQTAKDLDAKIDKTPYSLDSLTQEAKDIGNDALWRRGITNEALVQAVSLVNSFAIFSGWTPENFFNNPTNSETIDNGTPSKYISIDKNNNETSSQGTVAKLSGDAKGIYDLFKTINPLSQQEIESKPGLIRQSTMIFNYMNVSSQIDRLGVSVDHSLLDTNPEYLAGGQIDPNTKATRTIVYSDYKNPGKKIIHFVNQLTPITILKEVDVTGGTEIYPIIKNEQENNFKPYIQSAIFTFLKMVVENRMILTSAIVDLPPEEINMLDFLINKYTKINPDDNSENITIDNTILEDFWQAINNGSHNLQAVKTFLLGFNNSFSQTDIFKGMENLPGILSQDFSIMDFTTWAAEGNLIEAVNPQSNLNKDVQGIWTYQVDKSLDENIKINTGFNTYQDYEAAVPPKPADDATE